MLWIKFYLVGEFLSGKKIWKKWLHQRKLFSRNAQPPLVNLLFAGNINEVEALQFILPSCYSKDRSAVRFNVGRVNLDEISKT